MGANLSYIIAMPLLRLPRGGVAFRMAGAGCMSRIWAMSGFPETKALAAFCGNVAEVAIAIATQCESDLGSIPPIASGVIP